MVGQVVTFDGHRFNDRFFVGEVAVGLPEYDAGLRQNASWDGSTSSGVRMGTVAISVRLVAKPEFDVRDSLSALASWLDSDGEAPLTLSGDRGLWRLAVAAGAPVVNDYDHEDDVTVSFTQTDPALYGSDESVEVPSGGKVYFEVGGDYPTEPAIVAPSASAGAGGTWGVRLDDGDYVRVEIAKGPTQVEVDCAKRTRLCYVGDEGTIPTLDSTWLELAPGLHCIENDAGSGACTVTWTERWHR